MKKIVDKHVNIKTEYEKKKQEYAEIKQKNKLKISLLEKEIADNEEHIRVERGVKDTIDFVERTLAKNNGSILGINDEIYHIAFYVSKEKMRISLLNDKELQEIKNKGSEVLYTKSFSSFDDFLACLESTDVADTRVVYKKDPPIPTGDYQEDEWKNLFELRTLPWKVANDLCYTPLFNAYRVLVTTYELIENSRTGLNFADAGFNSLEIAERLNTVFETTEWLAKETDTKIKKFRHFNRKDLETYGTLANALAELNIVNDLVKKELGDLIADIDYDDERELKIYEEVNIEKKKDILKLDDEIKIKKIELDNATNEYNNSLREKLSGNIKYDLVSQIDIKHKYNANKYFKEEIIEEANLAEEKVEEKIRDKELRDSVKKFLSDMPKDKRVKYSKIISDIENYKKGTKFNKKMEYLTTTEHVDKKIYIWRVSVDDFRIFYKYNDDGNIDVYDMRKREKDTYKNKRKTIMDKARQ